MTNRRYTVKTVDGFRHVDEGGPSGRGPVLLLHGMLGETENWEATTTALVEAGYRVVIPVLPVYAMPMRQTSVSGLADHVVKFLACMGLPPAIVAGNSLGGHIALMLTLQQPGLVRALVLAGASGIYEVDMGAGVMRRQDKEFLRERAAITFHDPRHASEEVVEKAFHIVNDRSCALRLIRMARSVKAENVRDRLDAIRIPTLLVWGENDRITPPDVAREFHERISGSELCWVPECGHAPMIEHPGRFNEILLEFLERVDAYDAVA